MWDNEIWMFINETQLIETREVDADGEEDKNKVWLTPDIEKERY